MIIADLVETQKPVQSRDSWTPFWSGMVCIPYKVRTKRSAWRLARGVGARGQVTGSKRTDPQNLTTFEARAREAEKVRRKFFSLRRRTMGEAFELHGGCGAMRRDEKGERTLYQSLVFCGRAGPNCITA